MAWGAAWGQTSQLDRLKSISADPVALRAALEAGKQATMFCANCHGEDGISKSPDIPNLAGQNPAYLFEQLRKFGNGERKDRFMQGLIKMLNDNDRLHVSLFYANVPVPPSRSDAAQAANGKVLFTKLCVRCHGEQARGNNEIPRIAGQKLPYLQATLTHYRNADGVRDNQLMKIATGGLKNEDISAIANYLTQLP